MKRSYLLLAPVTMFSMALIMPVLSTHAAALIDIGTDTKNSANVDYSANSNTNLNTNTDVNTNVNTDVNAGVNSDSSGSANTGTGNSSSMTSTSGTNGDSSTMINASAHILSGDENVRVLRKDISVDADANNDANADVNTGSNTNVSTSMDNGSSVMITPDRISTNDDLKMFANESMRSDENIDEMNFTKDMVQVGYKEHGKLLGIFPVVMTLRAQTDANGKVTIDYPWYSFMVSKDKENLQSKLQAAVDESMSMRANADSSEGNVSFNASEAASIATRMHSVLKDTFEASNQTNTNADSSSSAGVSY